MPGHIRQGIEAVARYFHARQLFNELCDYEKQVLLGCSNKNILNGY
jgi:hypothetical protein